MTVHGTEINETQTRLKRMAIRGAGVFGPRTEVVANQDGQTPWGSFHLATVMFQRARQLRAGSRPRVEPEGHKPLRIALLEITSGAIPWEVHAAPAPAIVVD